MNPMTKLRERSSADRICSPFHPTESDSAEAKGVVLRLLMMKGNGRGGSCGRSEASGGVPGDIESKGGRLALANRPPVQL